MAAPLPGAGGGLAAPHGGLFRHGSGEEERGKEPAERRPERKGRHAVIGGVARGDLGALAPGG